MGSKTAPCCATDGISTTSTISTASTTSLTPSRSLTTSPSQPAGTSGTVAKPAANRASVISSSTMRPLRKLS